MKGAMAPPPGQGCPIKLHIYAPSKTHFTEKVPHLGHIRWHFLHRGSIWRKCNIWGIFYGESAPAGAHIAKKCPGWDKFCGKCGTSCHTWDVHMGQMSKMGHSILDIMNVWYGTSHLRRPYYTYGTSHIEHHVPYGTSHAGCLKWDVQYGTNYVPYVAVSCG